MTTALIALAHTMLGEFSPQTVLDALVRCLVDVLPITAAGATSVSPDSGIISAGTNTAARSLQKLQAKLGDGPGVWARRHGEEVSIAALGTDERFRRFTRLAIDLGLAAVFAFPLRRGSRRFGAVELYAEIGGPLTAAARADAQTLVEVATAYLLNAHGLADLRSVSDRSREAALHDPLTGLPNRILMLDRMEHAFRRSRRTGKKSAALFVDLDRLKEVNDVHGHRTGDQLIAAVAERMSQTIRPGDTAARMSGDEFVILCEELDAPADAAAIGARLLLAIGEPFVLSGSVVHVTASIGIAYADHGDHTPEQLLQEADSAMYQAKRAGGNRHLIYDVHLRRALQAQTALETDLRSAVDQGDLYNDYQAIVGSKDGQIAALEVFLRWRHSVHGLVSPRALLAMTEQSSAAALIGRGTMDRACADRDRWAGGRMDGGPAVSVNVPARHLTAPDFPETVAAVLARSAGPARKLVLQITETALLRDAERSMRALTALHAVGVTLALDGFGAGSSSLAHLRRYPFDVVKLDRSLLAGPSKGTSNLPVARAVTRLAHDLGMTVIADGVDTREQHRMVLELGCEAGQGAYFARPMTGPQVDALMYRGKPLGGRAPAAAPRHNETTTLCPVMTRPEIVGQITGRISPIGTILTTGD